MGYLSSKGGEGIHVMVGVDPGYLNVGLMKPRKGFTLVAGKEKLGVGKLIFHIDKICRIDMIKLLF